MANSKQAEPTAASGKVVTMPETDVAGAASTPTAAAEALVPPAVPATAAATAKARPARKTPTVDQTVARHQKALAEALEKAEAISYDPPAAAAKPGKAGKPAKTERPVKEEKAAKTRKPKLVRDSYAMPEAEYAQIAMLKKRLSVLGAEVKKSELLRAGVAALVALDDEQLKAVMAGVERIKTGRPAKK